MPRCHDCSKRKADVEIRQSDYMLCDSCEYKRRNSDNSNDFQLHNNQSAPTTSIDQNSGSHARYFQL